MAGRFVIEAVFKARDQLSAAISKMSGKFSKLGGAIGPSLAKIEEANARIASSMARAASAVGVASVAVGAGLAAALKPGLDFEEAISAVGAVSLMTRKDIAELEKKALELGASTKFSATEAAQAMEMMGRAGFKNAEIVSGIGGILSAAAAEGAGLAETASHVSNVLKGMGLATSESTRVADVLTLASARTNSSISSLGESMKNVASTARQFNIPLEEVSAAVALLQDVGLDASEAGSALNTMLTQMASPSDEVAARMKKLGVSFKDAQGNMLPLKTVFGQFEKAAKKSGGNMEQVAFFADLVGLRGQKAAVNLKDLFASGKFSDLADELQGAAGSAEKMAKLRMNNLKGDLEQLGGAIETVLIGMFNMQSGPLRGIVQSMGAWVDANGKLIQSRIGEFLTGLVAAVQNARFAFDLFASGIKQGVAPLTSAIGALLGPVKQVSDGLGTWPLIVQNIGRAAGGFLTFVVAVKAAQAAVFAFGVASKLVTGTLWLGRAAVLAYSAATNAATARAVALRVAQYAGAAATWAKTAALAAGEVATTRFTMATIASSAKTVANTALTWARQAAQWAWNAATAAGTAVASRFTAATILSTAKNALDTAATWARAAATGALKLALGAASLASTAWAIATGKATAATMAAQASLAPLLVTLAAAAAAIGALTLAWKTWESEKGNLGGLEGLKSFLTGGFEGLDEHFNEKARAEARARAGAAAAGAPPAQVVSPQERVAKSVTETKTTTIDKSEVTLKIPEGVTATVTKPPKGKGGVRVAHTGAM